MNIIPEIVAEQNFTCPNKRKINKESGASLSNQHNEKRAC